MYNYYLKHSKFKTRLLATNSLAFLPECDRIIVLEEGKILEIGSYDHLIKTSKLFREFIGGKPQNTTNMPTG